MFKHNLLPILFIGIIFSGCQQTDVKISSINIDDANAEDIDKWNTTVDFMLGIRGNDPVGATLTTLNQDGTYDLQVRQKQNLAGTLNRYGTADEDNGSSDLNFLMMPAPPFQSFYNNADKSDDDEWFFPFVLEGDNRTCSETKIRDTPFNWGELALPDGYINNNKFFPRSDDDHCVNTNFLHKEDTFGMYGILVTDDEHGRQPEMHPIQQFWFRDKTIMSKSENAYWLFFAQDASDRFSDWIGSPLHGQFLIAFSVRPSPLQIANTPLTMDISIEEQTDVVTENFSPDRTDGDNGISHSLFIDGQKLLTVNEFTNNAPDQAGDDQIGIQFTDMKKFSDGSIRGYVQVSAVIGDFNTDPFGYLVLHLVIHQPEAPVLDNVIK